MKCRRRSVGGLFATVMDYFWREDSPWLVLQMTDGRRMAVLATWTDLPANTFPSKRRTPLLQPSVLVEMARQCQRLRPRRIKRRR